MYYNKKIITTLSTALLDGFNYKKGKHSNPQIYKKEQQKQRRKKWNIKKI